MTLEQVLNAGLYVGGGGGLLVMVGLFIRKVIASTKNTESQGATLDAMQRANQAVYSQITQEVNRLAKINSDLSTEVVNLKREVGELSGQVATLESANEHLNRTILDLNHEVSYYRNAVSDHFANNPDSDLLPYGRRDADKQATKEAIVEAEKSKGVGVFAQSKERPVYSTRSDFKRE